MVSSICRKTIFFIFFVVFLILGCSGGVGGGGVSSASSGLVWDAPITYTDGNGNIRQLNTDDINGYRIYYRTESASYSSDNSYFVFAPATSASTQALNLKPGKYYIVVTVVVDMDRELDISNEISLDIN